MSNTTTHFTPEIEDDIDLFDPFGTEDFDSTLPDPFADALRGDISSDLMTGMPNFFGDTAGYEAKRSQYNREKVLAMLQEHLENQEYEEFVALTLEEFEVHFQHERTPLRILSLSLPLEYFAQVINATNWKESDPFYFDISRSDMHFLVEKALETDDVEKITWLMPQFECDTAKYQDLLDIAVHLKALDSLRFLLSLPKDCHLSPTLALLWASQNTGDPMLDACIRAVAPYVLPPDLQSDITEGYIPYHADISFEFMVQHDTSHKKQHQREYLEFFSCTPFMSQLIENGRLTDKEASQVIQHLDRTCATILNQDNCLDSPKKPYVHYLMAQTIFPKTATLILPAVTLSDIINVLDKILRYYPSMLNKQKTRCLLTVLALVKQPNPLILEWVSRLKGKNLCICNFDYPWFEDANGFPSHFVSGCLFAHWESRMPKKLKPVISHSGFPVVTDVVRWLSVCTVAGKPPVYHLSNLALSLLELDYDDPVFLGEHAPGGIFHQEKNKYLLYLVHNSQQFRSHYLVAISMLQEETNYDF